MGRSLIACNVGVCLEGFDFIAYGAFSAIIAKLYFPAASPLVATMLTLGGFAAAYVVRPLGGLFWGVQADRRGRRLVLAWTAIVMACGTLLLAVTPPYAAIGIAAPLLILAARIIQGFAVSGEFASATAMLVELAPPGRRSLFASTQMACQALTAGLAAAIVMLLFLLLPAAAVEGWGWRAVFGAGALVGPLGLYIRARMAESPEFVAIARAHAIPRAPLREVLGRYPRELACMAGLVVISSAALYLILIFLPLYAVRELGLSQSDAQTSLILSTIVQAAVILTTGRLADRHGPIRILLPACILYSLAAYPLLARLVEAPSFASLLATQMTAAILLGWMSGPLPSVLSALLPTEVRSTGLGLTYNLVGAIFGGLGPLIITALVALTGNRAAPGWWAAGTGLVGTIAAFALWRRSVSPKALPQGRTT